MAGRNNKLNVVPVELAEIRLDGEKVIGIVANYRSPNGYCVADKTPVTGTYQAGQLSIKSWSPGTLLVLPHDFGFGVVSIVRICDACGYGGSWKSHCGWRSTVQRIASPRAAYAPASAFQFAVLRAARRSAWTLGVVDTPL